MTKDRNELLLRYGQELDRRLEDAMQFLGTRDKSAVIIVSVHEFLKDLEKERRKERLKDSMEEIQEKTV